LCLATLQEVNSFTSVII